MYIKKKSHQIIKEKCSAPFDYSKTKNTETDPNINAPSTPDTQINTFLLMNMIGGVPLS